MINPTRTPTVSLITTWHVTSQYLDQGGCSVRRFIVCVIRTEIQRIVSATTIFAIAQLDPGKTTANQEKSFTLSVVISSRSVCLEWLERTFG